MQPQQQTHEIQNVKSLDKSVTSEIETLVENISVELDNIDDFIHCTALKELEVKMNERKIHYAKESRTTC